MHNGHFSGAGKNFKKESNDKGVAFFIGLNLKHIKTTKNLQIPIVRNVPTIYNLRLVQG